MTGSTIALVVIATLFALMNGAKDGANSMATIITSRSMAPTWAVGMVTLAEFVGPLIFGVAVAYTIGTSIASSEAITLTVVLAGLISATVWNIAMWWLGIPTSSSHALIGGLIGAVLVANQMNFAVLHMPGLVKVGLGLFLAPVVVIVAAYFVMKLATFLLRGARPGVNWFFKRGQILTTLGLAVSHGANDAPKAMGIIAMGLVAAGTLPQFYIPRWIIFLSAAAVALGTMFGGWRMVRTIGTRFYRVRPIHAFNSQMTSSLVVIGATLIGAPASTSQVVSSSIAGVGAAERLTKVRWGVLRSIATGWLFTIPVTAVAAGLVYLLLRPFLGR